jgi:hypothetical protein
MKMFRNQGWSGRGTKWLAVTNTDTSAELATARQIVPSFEISLPAFKVFFRLDRIHAAKEGRKLGKSGKHFPFPFLRMSRPYLFSSYQALP